MTINIYLNPVIILSLIILLFSWHLNGIDYFSIYSSSSVFQSIHSWLPLIKGIQVGNLFPSQPNIDIEAHNFLFCPYLTLWFYSFMVWLVGIKGIVIVSTVVFPVCSFYLQHRIFSRQLNEIWSMTMLFRPIKKQLQLLGKNY